MQTRISETIQFISPLSNQSIELIQSIITIKNLEKNQVFTERGKNNSSEYFLLDGICKSYLHNPEGEEITLSFFTSKSILSPHTTRSSEGKSLLNFKALTPITLGVLDASRFENLMIENLEIREFGNTVLRNELSNKVKKEIGLASLTAKDRLVRFRQEFLSLENHIPHTDIASYLGITNVSLSRLRKEK